MSVILLPDEQISLDHLFGSAAKPVKGPFLQSQFDDTVSKAEP